MGLTLSGLDSADMLCPPPALRHCLSLLGDSGRVPSGRPGLGPGLGLASHWENRRGISRESFAG